MKTNLTVSGNVELDEKEVQQALLEYAKREGNLVAIINSYLAPKNLTTNRVARTDTPTGLRVVATVTSASSDEIPFTPGGSVAVKEPRVRVGKGFKKKNLGFAGKFTEIVDDARKSRKKHLSLDELLEEFQFAFGKENFKRKRLQIYLADKNLQKSRRFQYDSRNNRIIL
jgi:hypothetical protein